MLEAFKFVRGAISTKDFVPALTHFRIKDRKILGFNGELALCCPIDVGLNCVPSAVPLVRAIETCKDVVSLHLKGSKLIIRSGPFTSYVNCIDEGDFPTFLVQGKIIDLPYDILPAIKILDSFVGEDASRPWACSILFDGQSAFATNNVLAVELWLGCQFPTRVGIPKSAISELLRIGKSPQRLQLGDGYLVFHFEDGGWLRASVLACSYPDIRATLDKVSGDLKPVPDDFFPKLKDIEPFLDKLGSVHVNKDRIASLPSEEDGTSFDFPEPLHVADPICLNGRQLLKLSGVADRFDFTRYPMAIPFRSRDGLLRGAMAGIRL